MDEETNTVQKLRSAIDGLTYPSEEDNLWQLVHYDNFDATTYGLAKKLCVSNHNTRDVTDDEFFSTLTTEGDDADRYGEMRKVLDMMLGGYTIHRFNDAGPVVTIAIIGLDQDNKHLIVIHTTSIES